MKRMMPLIIAVLLTLGACELTPTVRCDDGDWDPTVLTCESVARAASTRLGSIRGITDVEIIGPQGCPPGGRGCALQNDVAIVAVTTAAGRSLSFLVTIENGQAIAGPIEESAPAR